MSRLNPHCEQSVSGTCSVTYTYIAQIQLHREERVSFLQAILYTKHGNFYLDCYGVLTGCVQMVCGSNICSDQIKSKNRRQITCAIGCLHLLDSPRPASAYLTTFYYTTTTSTGSGGSGQLGLAGFGPLELV